MKKLSIVAAIAGAALLCMPPLSIHGSLSNIGTLSVVLNAANAADREIPPNRRAYRYRYYRTATYDLYCGGPYVGGGWNGGTYYGGPWIDLGCLWH